MVGDTFVVANRHAMATVFSVISIVGVVIALECLVMQCRYGPMYIFSAPYSFSSQVIHLHSYTYSSCRAIPKTTQNLLITSATMA